MRLSAHLILFVSMMAAACGQPDTQNVAERLSGKAQALDRACIGVDCSGHGVCYAEQGQAYCLCQPGYAASGLECLADTSGGENHRDGLGDEVVAIALAEEGRGPNGVGDDLDRYPWDLGRYLGEGEWWCSEFVSWAYKAAGRPFTGGYETGGWMLKGSTGIRSWFQNHETWIDRWGSEWDSFTPAPGDYIRWDNDSGGHSAIVQRAAGDTLWTIDGNYGNRVVVREIYDYKSNSDIDGFGHFASQEPAADARYYGNWDPVSIPDDDSAGVESTIWISDTFDIASFSVEIDLTHTYVGDLVVRLTRNGTTVTLWDRQGDSDDDIRRNFRVDDFDGMDAWGSWTLEVSDHAGQDVGILNGFALWIVPEVVPGESWTDSNQASLEIPDGDPQGVTSYLLAPDLGVVDTVSVELDIRHGWVGDLEVVLSHGDVSVAVWSQQGGSDDDIRGRFDVTGFKGQPTAGFWELTVIDHDSIVEGSLESWSLTLQAL
jgi:subtilisin-like proprotein convertase family protein